MKTKFISICAALALAVGASSCVDLDTAPLDQKSDATMWQTAQDAEQAVSYLYNYMTDAHDGLWLNDEDVYTDNAVHGIKWAVGQRAHGVWNPTDFAWGTEYAYIRKANLVFANIDRVTTISDSERNDILGQAHFFRALVYSDLIRQFGDVPYTESPMELSEQEGIVRNDWKEVYSHVMSDFDQAIAMLPDYTTNGRVNKQTARAFKAKTALYFANPDCQHYIADGYQVAATEAKAVIDSGHYGLYDEGYTGTAKDYTGKYAEMFWGLNMDNSNESLYSTHYIASLNKGTEFIGFECFPKLGWGGTNPTQGLVDAFEDCEGAPISKSTIYDPLNPAANRDPRLAVNVIFSGDVMYGVEVNTTPLPSSGDRALYPVGCGDATLTGYQAKKWLNPAVYPETEGWNHDAAPSSMRFTEVLLMYAEAQNEISPLSSDAFAAVNRVRARVGMPALQNSDASKPTYCATQDDLRQRIRNEFRVEFCFEGDHRQWDARRWNIATDVLNAPRYTYRYKIVNDAANAKPGDNGQVCLLYVADGQQDEILNQVITYQPHNYLFPIPQDQIDLNDKLTQNPGY
ncbi:MAG: RagB/SusD family nutrient uptake outer membrane protein [Pseudoflavonifractor sp.]|nr:RagB/SusD family nutrient uptake outer membrane protein [Alloprevotella sp.]MCM1116288.1 RagB/SusD family nutrient uptake outer membrane protein [Pseudoflavonifractor sp.]